MEDLLLSDDNSPTPSSGSDLHHSRSIAAYSRSAPHFSLSIETSSHAPPPPLTPPRPPNPPPPRRQHEPAARGVEAPQRPRDAWLLQEGNSPQLQERKSPQSSERWLPNKRGSPQRKRALWLPPARFDLDGQTFDHLREGSQPARQREGAQPSSQTSPQTSPQKAGRKSPGRPAWSGDARVLHGQVTTEGPSWGIRLSFLEPFHRL